MKKKGGLTYFDDHITQLFIHFFFLLKNHSDWIHDKFIYAYSFNLFISYYFMLFSSKQLEKSKFISRYEFSHIFCETHII